MSKEKFFSGAIRVVFLFAFAAFLYASIRHVAVFFHNFEPETVDMASSYMLAIAVDGTALILTIGVMFFSGDMPLHAKVIVWLFILGLTGFSWVVNWEYAVRFQSSDLTTNPTLQWLNPILASSFAFLNLAYSIVSEFFSLRVKTVSELQAELHGLDERISLEMQIKQKRRATSGPGFIQRTKKTVLEVKQAVKDVVKTSETDGQTTPVLPAVLPENDLGTETVFSQNEEHIEDEPPCEMPHLPDRTTDPNLHTVKPVEPMEGQEEAAIQDELPRPMKPQKRYTVEEAIRLTICKQNGIKIADIRAAIKAGQIRTNQSGTLSKTALENWLKMRQKTAA